MPSSANLIPPASSAWLDDAGDAQLTPREQEVLRYVSLGLTNAEIGTQMHISLSTVKKHFSSILEKLHLDNRKQLIHIASRLR